MSKTTRIWEVRIRGEIRNPREYPDSTQLQGENFKNWETLIEFSRNFWKISKIAYLVN